MAQRALKPCRALSLQRYKFTIEYKRGVTNYVADALSRSPLLGQQMQVDPDLAALANATRINTDSRWETLVSREEPWRPSCTMNFVRR